MTSLPLFVTEPFRAWVTLLTARLSPSTSLSLARTGTTTAISSVVVAESSLATGGSLTGSTVIETVASLLSASPSFALNVKESLPLKSELGV